jgi:peptidoglycan hydrolase CwlO-like protein
MTTTNNPFDLGDELAGIDTNKYYDVGHECATNTARTNPENISFGLDVALKMFREDSKWITEQRVKKLEDNIIVLNKNKEGLESDLKVLETNKNKKEIERNDLVAEKDALESKSGISSNLTPLIILGVSLILLSAFVFAFYYYVGRATIVPMIIEALGIGQSVDALPILFPFIALIYGVMIHVFLKQIRQSQTLSKKVLSILILVVILGVAFWLDVVMGTAMAENAHVKDFNQGLTSVEWVDSMAWSDNRFYIVLILGFVSYLIWGILLSNFVSHPNFNKPEEIKRLTKKISEIDIEMSEINGQIDNLKNKIDNLKKEIDTKEYQIHEYKHGTIFYSIPIFDGIIGRFMEGYSAFVSGAFRTDQSMATAINEKANKVKQEWVEEKKKTLNQEL